jgi:hypothetical protein
MLDPLDVFLRSTFDARGLTPIPLISTDHDVVIDAGLAMVTTHRLFKNVENQNIEAVLTFPLPVLATLFELNAEVEGRKLRATAQARAEARQTYEDAIDRGKSAILHEELLRGIHMISVANIPSGGEVKVTTKWALPLSVVGARATLRIPQTVGDIYGRSSLADADDILSGGLEQPVLLSVRGTGNIEVNGENLVGGHAKLKNSKPIDIVADIWERKPIVGHTTSGQAVTLTLSPQPAGERALSVAVLVDHSGSMAGSFGGRGAISAHDAARNGVAAIASSFGAQDFVDLWEFDTSTTHVGSASSGSKAELLRLAGRLTPPCGGTEIGGAIQTVSTMSAARDVLLLTDGLSHALDVQKLARSGRRISVILIGENSLEAKIGHLVALTGGDIFIATAADLEAVMAAAIEGLRRPYAPLPSIRELPDRLECSRSNILIQAEWSTRPAETVSPELAQAAVAVASSLIVSCAETTLSSEVAAAAGIVSHLTSLVLVDEASGIQEQLPTLRKVALPDNHIRYSMRPMKADARIVHSMPSPSEMESLSLPGRSMRFSRRRDEYSPTERRASSTPYAPMGRLGRLAGNLTGSDRQLSAWQLTEEMELVARQIDWGQFPSNLIYGDLSELSGEVAVYIRRLADIEAVAEFAELNGLPSEVVVIGLLARTIASEDRRANRVWKAISDLMQTSAPAELAELERQIIASL